MTKKIGEYINWFLTILLILVVLYAKFGTNLYCPPTIYYSNGQNIIGNFTQNLTNLTGNLI